MVVGIFINRRTYPALEYAEAAMITLGVTLFTLTERSAPTVQREDSFYGLGLLVMYLTCDSFTSQWQSKVYKQFSIDQYQMMLGVNIWSMLMTGAECPITTFVLRTIRYLILYPTHADHLWNVLPPITFNL